MMMARQKMAKRKPRSVEVQEDHGYLGLPWCDRCGVRSQRLHGTVGAKTGIDGTGQLAMFGELCSYCRRDLEHRGWMLNEVP